MSERSFLADIMRRVVRAGRGAAEPEGDIVSLCHDLIGDRGEASGLVRAEHILDLLEASPDAELGDVFARLSQEFGADEGNLQSAITAWRPGDVDATRALHFAAEPKSQELIRVLNRTPGATTRLVRLRARLLDHLRENPSLKGLDTDFQHLFSSWFNRGFLEIRRIDWSTPASILEKIIAYEAVHEINGWDDLRQRVGAPRPPAFRLLSSRDTRRAVDLCRGGPGHRHRPAPSRRSWNAITRADRTRIEATVGGILFDFKLPEGSARGFPSAIS